MEKVVFTFVNYKGNVGDFNCSPFDYYKFPFKASVVHFPYITAAIEGNPIAQNFLLKDKIVIIGGGGLLTHKDNFLQNTLEYLVENNKVILWGIGSNTSLDIKWDVLNHPNILLAGVRDQIPGINSEYVPCVSCKHPIFDKTHTNPKGIGILEHYDYSIDINEDKIQNNTSIENFVEFIASKESLVSSTYHGVYWSQLLNKKVVYYPTKKQINSKFVTLKHGINICDSSNYKDILNYSSTSFGLLKESRYINDKFYDKVVNTIQNLIQ
jgi:hypothetical protein